MTAFDRLPSRFADELSASKYIKQPSRALATVNTKVTGARGRTLYRSVAIVSALLFIPSGSEKITPEPQWLKPLLFLSRIIWCGLWGGPISRPLMRNSREDWNGFAPSSPTSGSIHHGGGSFCGISRTSEACGGFVSAANGPAILISLCQAPS